MKAGRKIRQRWGNGRRDRWFWLIAVVTGALFPGSGGDASAQQAPAPTPTRVQPNVATNHTLTEAERQRAAAAAREMREFKERLSLQSPTTAGRSPVVNTSALRSLEQNIKVDRSAASVYTAPRTNSVSYAPVPATTAPAPEKKKNRGGLLAGGLFGNKDKKDTKKNVTKTNYDAGYEFDSDVVEVIPLGEAAQPPVPLGESNQASADRIPPPPGFSEPAPLPPPSPVESLPPVGTQPMPAPGAPLAVAEPAIPSTLATNPPPTLTPNPNPPEEKGLIGGLFSKNRGSKSNGGQSAAPSGGNSKKGFLGRLFGRNDPAPQPANPAATVSAPAAPSAVPPPAIPPPDFPTTPAPAPTPTQPGSFGNPTLSGQPGAPVPSSIPPAAATTIPAPQPSRPPLVISSHSSRGGTPSLIPPPRPPTPPAPSAPARPTAVSAYTGSLPAATAATPAPIPAPAPQPAPAATVAPSGGAHFLVVKSNVGTPLQNASGAAIQALRSGEVVQFQKSFGAMALVRLPSGTEGYVAVSQLRDATFNEAARFYAARSR